MNNPYIVCIDIYLTEAAAQPFKFSSAPVNKRKKPEALNLKKLQCIVYLLWMAGMRRAITIQEGWEGILLHGQSFCYCIFCPHLLSSSSFKWKSLEAEISSLDTGQKPIDFLIYYPFLAVHWNMPVWGHVLRHELKPCSWKKTRFLHAYQWFIAAWSRTSLPAIESDRAEAKIVDERTKDNIWEVYAFGMMSRCARIAYLHLQFVGSKTQALWAAVRNAELCRVVWSDPKKKSCRYFYSCKVSTQKCNTTNVLYS